MKPFELINYNFEEQRFDVRINHPLKDGYFVVRDIDLDTTIYKMKLWDVNHPIDIFFIPIPKFAFDFQQPDFGGFSFELVDEGVIIDKEFMRLRNTEMYKHKQDMINDFYHPVFVNYREFFVWDRYSCFDLSGCEKVIDAGASVGLFTKYMLNKGAKEVYAVECDDRSIKALVSNFSYYDNVKIVPKALHSSEGELPLFFKEDNPLVNSLNFCDSEFAGHSTTPNSKMVPTTTLEKLVEETGWDEIDLLKIDIEGSEWEVLDSTSNHIFEITNKFLLEYHIPNERLYGVVDRMRSLGFKHWFEPGFNEDSANGTVLFYR
jgi:FkbM family methyltransferase